MRRRLGIAVGLCALPLVAAGWTDGSAGTRARTDNKPVTITFWSNYSAPHELAALQSAFDAFHEKYPWITVKGTGNMNDDDPAAISSGTPPDVAARVLARQRRQVLLDRRLDRT